MEKKNILKIRAEEGKPKISVLMTVYNADKFLKEAIDSVLNQSLRDFEFIIVNDGSTDNSENIIKEYMKKDKRIVYLKNNINKGLENWHNILNMGLEVAKGKYIARIDADDICYPNRFMIQYNFLEKNKDIFLIGSSADVIDQNGKKVDSILKKPWPPKIIQYRIGVSNPFVHSSIMFRNEGYKYLSRDEHTFYFQLIIRGKRLRNLRQTLVKYRINPTGLMARYADLSGNKYKELYQKKD